MSRVEKLLLGFGMLVSLVLLALAAWAGLPLYLRWAGA